MSGTTTARRVSCAFLASALAVSGPAAADEETDGAVDEMTDDATLRTTGPGGSGRSGARSTLLEDGGYLEIGLGLRAEQSVREPLDRDADIEVTATLSGFVGGEWRYRRAFVEGRWGSIDGASLGLTAFANESRTIDVLLAHLAPTTNVAHRRDGDEGTPAEASDEALVERDTSFGSSGLRWREFRGDVLYQIGAVVDWEHDNGVLVSAHVGRQWPFGNWLAEGAIGLRWASDELADFLYGVDPDEASARFAAHEAEAGVLADVELALSRPLGRNWVLRTQARTRFVDEGIVDSPLVARHAGVGLDAAISYVF